MSAPERYAFGEFVLERSQQRVLRKDGSELALTPRLFSALLLFVENADALLEKDALMRALWPGLVVEENNLSQTVSSLRRALGDEPPGSRYIQTVARRGFRFIAAVSVVPEAPPRAPAPAMPSVPATPSLASAAPPVADPPVAPAVAPGRHVFGERRLGMILAGGTALLGGAFGWAWLNTGAPPEVAPDARATLAVLPFKPLADESRDELLEVGMADSLITRLSTVPGLVVRSVGSVRRYAGAEQDPALAARDLDVTWIVDGSLQRRGDRLRVTARLLHAADGTAAWSDSFDETFTGVFEMQDVISTRVMLALGPRLAVPRTGAAGSRLTEAGGTRNVDAYQLYLSASQQLQSRSAVGARNGIELFNKALTVDPAYALAYVGLAEASRETLLAADAVPVEVFESARVASRRALALAPHLAEALTEGAFGLYYFEFDWPGAERGFRRALSGNPNVAMAHFGLAQLLLTQDRPDEGFVHLRLARELDPMSPFLNTLEASYLLARGRHDEARSRLNRAFDLAPDFWLAYRTLGLMQMAEQQPERAIASLQRAASLAGGNSRIQALLAMHLARNGRRDEARAIQVRLLDLAGSRHVSPVSLAVVHAALGEKPQALDALERAFAGRDTQLVFMKDDPRWSALRKEQRFVALLRALKLDRYGPGLSPT